MICTVSILSVPIDLRAFFLANRHGSKLALELSSNDVRSFASMTHSQPNGLLILGLHLHDGSKDNVSLRNFVVDRCIDLFHYRAFGQIDHQFNIVVNPCTNVRDFDEVGRLAIRFDWVVVVLDCECKFALSLPAQGRQAAVL